MEQAECGGPVHQKYTGKNDYEGQPAGENGMDALPGARSMGRIDHSGCLKDLLPAKAGI
jgi:hypothetical protein